MNNSISNVLAPPTPPQLKLSVADRLSNLRVMSEELDAGVKYCEDSIEYYKKIIEQFESRLAKEKELLELTKNTVASLSEFVTAPPAEIKPEPETLTTTKVNVNGNGKAKANGNGKVATIELEPATKTKTSKTKTKAKTKSSRTKTRIQAKTKTKTNTKKKVASKSKSTLPPSERLEGCRSLTSAVLDFMRGKNEVVSVKDIIKYFYPNGLPKEADRNKISNSFTSILSVQTKKKVLERTVQGKYKYVKRRSNKK